jgi:predicted RNA-binding Zn-ribbon protein involved in translation (DUF1610 family)
MGNKIYCPHCGEEMKYKNGCTDRKTEVTVIQYSLYVCPKCGYEKEFEREL